MWAAGAFVFYRAFAANPDPSAAPGLVLFGWTPLWAFGALGVAACLAELRAPTPTYNGQITNPWGPTTQQLLLRQNQLAAEQNRLLAERNRLVARETGVAPHICGSHRKESP